MDELLTSPTSVVPWLSKARKCRRSKEHLLVWGDKSTFNPPIVLSDRATKYKDKRTQQSSTPGQTVAFDIWGLDCDGQFWGRIQGGNTERWNQANGAAVDKHDNQLPEVYVKRMIETFTNPGDRVLR